MKKDKYKKVYIVLFLLLCLIPSAGMLFVQKTVGAANEFLASEPSLIKADGRVNEAVLSDTADYIADRFAFRQQLVTAWAKLNAKVFNSSSEKQVILGRDGWLFFSDTLNDYCGVGMSADELAAAARNLSLVEECVNSRGADFLFTVAPNKNSLYGDFMPDCFTPCRSSSNSTRLQEYLAEADVSYADLFSAFTDREQLYYISDSHWTYKGAALAADVILGALDENSSFFNENFSVPIAHRGDLYEMLFPADSYTETDYKMDKPFSFVSLNEPNGGNAITIKTQNSGESGSLMCWRDSFGIALYPYLAEKYSSAVFSRASAYDLMQDAALNADTVVIELVERNLRQLITEAAVYPAPARELPICHAGDTTVNFVCESGTTAATKDYVHIYCELPISLVDISTPLYIKTNSKAYEASTTISDADTVVISAWLPMEDSIPQAVVMGQNDILVEYAAKNEEQVG